MIEESCRREKREIATKRHEIHKASFFLRLLCLFVAVFTRWYFSTRAFDLQLALNVHVNRTDCNNIVVFSSDFPFTSRSMASISTSQDPPRCGTASSEKSGHAPERF